MSGCVCVCLCLRKTETSLSKIVSLLISSSSSLASDPALAILQKKVKPNRLIIEDAVNDDNSVVSLSQVRGLRLKKSSNCLLPAAAAAKESLRRCSVHVFSSSFVLTLPPLCLSCTDRPRWTSWTCSAVTLCCSRAAASRRR